MVKSKSVILFMLFCLCWTYAYSEPDLTGAQSTVSRSVGYLTAVQPVFQYLGQALDDADKSRDKKAIKIPLNETLDSVQRIARILDRIDWGRAGMPAMPVIVESMRRINSMLKPSLREGEVFYPEQMWQKVREEIAGINRAIQEEIKNPQDVVESSRSFELGRSLGVSFLLQAMTMIFENKTKTDSYEVYFVEILKSDKILTIFKTTIDESAFRQNAPVLASAITRAINEAMSKTASQVDEAKSMRTFMGQVRDFFKHSLSLEKVVALRDSAMNGLNVSLKTISESLPQDLQIQLDEISFEESMSRLRKTTQQVHEIENRLIIILGMASGGHLDNHMVTETQKFLGHVRAMVSYLHEMGRELENHPNRSVAKKILDSVNTNLQKIDPFIGGSLQVTSLPMRMYLKPGKGTAWITSYFQTYGQIREDMVAETLSLVKGLTKVNQCLSVYSR